MKVKPYFMIHKPLVQSNEPFHKPHNNNQTSILVPKIHLHLTHISHMKSMFNLKTAIPISFLTPHILFNLPIHYPKHPPLMKHHILPQLHSHPFMITQTHKYLHHQEYHHHLLPTHMVSLCCMSNHFPLNT